MIIIVWIQWKGQCCRWRRTHKNVNYNWKFASKSAGMVHMQQLISSKSAERSNSITIFMELTAQKGKGDRGKRTSDRTRTRDLRSMLYHGVSATRAMETGRDPSSPIALMYRSQVCRYPATLIWRPAPRGWYCVLCDANSCNVLRRCRWACYHHIAHSTSLKAQVLSVAG